MDVLQLCTDTGIYAAPQPSAFLQPQGCFLLDPQMFVPPEWTSRIEISFNTREFDELCADIEHTSGNVDPIVVRVRLPGQTPEETLYELISGHRRWHACVKLGLKVLALVVQASDQDAALALVHSNSFRSGPRPFELGGVYQTLLDTKVFDTQARMCEHLGRHASDVSNALALVRLPPKVLKAFASPLNLRYRDAGPLKAICEEDLRAVEKRVQRLLGYSLGTFAHDETVEILLGHVPVQPQAKAASLKIDVHDGQEVVGTIKQNAAGKITLSSTASFSEDVARAMVEEARVFLINAASRQKINNVAQPAGPEEAP